MSCPLYVHDQIKVHGFNSLLAILTKTIRNCFLLFIFVLTLWPLNWNFLTVEIENYVMLTKKEIEQFIEKKNSSLKIIKTTITPKSSLVWNNFNCIYVNDVKQEYVICNQCEDLLIYKPSSGTNSLSKHIHSCQKDKRTVSSNQTNINQFYSSSKNEPSIPNRVKEEIRVACVEFAALDSRPFKTIQGTGFKNLAQKILDAGKYLPISKDINVEKLLPHPTTVKKRHF